MTLESISDLLEVPLSLLKSFITKFSIEKNPRTSSCEFLCIREKISSKNWRATLPLNILHVVPNLLLIQYLIYYLQVDSLVITKLFLGRYGSGKMSLGASARLLYLLPLSKPVFRMSIDRHCAMPAAR